MHRLRAVRRRVRLDHGAIKKPPGLIRYGSQTTLETQKKTRILRPRVVIYPILLGALLVALVALGGRSHDAEVTVLRGIGEPFAITAAGVTDQLRVKVRNRSDHAERYQIEITDPTVRLIAPENPLDVAAGAQRTTAVFVVAPREAFVNGRHEIVVRITDTHGLRVDVPYRLVGPEPEARP